MVNNVMLTFFSSDHYLLLADPSSGFWWRFISVVLKM